MTRCDRRQDAGVGRSRLRHRRFGRHVQHRVRPTGRVVERRGLSANGDDIWRIQGGCAPRKAAAEPCRGRLLPLFVVVRICRGDSDDGLPRRFYLDGIMFRDAGTMQETPKRGPYYSLNDAREPDWPAGLQSWVYSAKRGKTAAGTKVLSRTPARWSRTSTGLLSPADGRAIRGRISIALRSGTPRVRGQRVAATRRAGDILSVMGHSWTFRAGRHTSAAAWMTSRTSRPAATSSKGRRVDACTTCRGPRPRTTSAMMDP